MNARQRRYLVTSLRSLSVLIATSYLAVLALGWLFDIRPSAVRSLLSAPMLATMALTCGGALWLAHYFRLGAEVRVWTLGPPHPEVEVETESDDDCPNWPTIVAWLVTDLESGEAHRIGSHVSGCDKCRRRLALMSAVQEMSSDRGR